MGGNCLVGRAGVVFIRFIGCGAVILAAGHRVVNHVAGAGGLACVDRLSGPDGVCSRTIFVWVRPHFAQSRRDFVDPLLPTAKYAYAWLMDIISGLHNLRPHHKGCINHR